MKKLLYIFGFFFLTLFFSCSSSDGDGIDGSSSGSFDGVLLTRILEDTGESIFSYEEGNKLSRIGQYYVDVDDVQFTYSGDFITKWGFLNDNGVISDYTTYNYTDGKITESRLYTYSGLLEISEWTYTSNIIIINILHKDTYNGVDSWRERTSKLYLNINNNVTKSEYFEDNSLKQETTYLYDSKNHPYKNIRGFSLLGLWGNRNNILKETTTSYLGSQSYTDETKYSYEYNEFNFPKKSTIINNNGSAEGTTLYYYN